MPGRFNFIFFPFFLEDMVARGIGRITKEPYSFINVYSFMQILTHQHIHSHFYRTEGGIFLLSFCRVNFRMGSEGNS